MNCVPKENLLAVDKEIRETARKLAMCLRRLCPDNREKSLAITKLEESVMWANASTNRYYLKEDEKM